jgi:hypothetical protein
MERQCQKEKKADAIVASVASPGCRKMHDALALDWSPQPTAEDISSSPNNISLVAPLSSTLSEKTYCIDP